MFVRIKSYVLVRRVTVITGVTLLSLFSGNTFADAVLEMCADPNKVCECAASQLKSEVGDTDYALYEAIGSNYLSNKNGGMNMVEAWDAAVTMKSNQQGESFATTLNKTNKIGRAHREAIKACKN